MLNIQVSKRKETEDYVAVNTMPSSLPFSMRQFITICSICIFTLVCALPVIGPGNSLDTQEEDQPATSLYTLLGTPQVRPAAINEKQMGEKYLAENEQDIVVTPAEITQENYDDDIALPRDFFIVQNAALKPQLRPHSPPQLAEPVSEEPQLKEDLKDTGLELSATAEPKVFTEEKTEPKVQEEKVPVAPVEPETINPVQELKELAAKLDTPPEPEEVIPPVTPVIQPEVKPAPPLPSAVETAKEPVVTVKPEKRPSGSWYQFDVQKGQSLSEIFTQLNLSSATLRRLKKVAKGRELALSDGDELHLLVDNHNILKELVKPLPNGEQVRFTRMSGKHDFTVVHESKNAHVKDPKEIASFQSAMKMPSAVEAAERLAREKEQEQELKLAQQNSKQEQADLEESYNLAYINRPQLVVGKVESGENFKKTARRLGLDQIALSEIQSAVLTKVNLTRLRPNDTVRILFSGRGAASHVQAVEINSQIYGKVTVYKHPQNNNFYAENEFHPTTGVFRRFPIAGQIKITSPYNPKRIHPIMHRIAPHNGVDFKVPIGTPIYSPADGVVTFAGYVRGGGYTVIIKHFNDYATVYMHLSKFDVRNGQDVKAGQIIAKSGNTGRSTGPHLHYEIRINDHPVDPLKVDLPNNRTPKLAQAEKIAFDNNVRSLKAQLYK